MTDEQLAQYLGILLRVDWPQTIANLTPLKRKTYERMAALEVEIDLWHKGLGPKPRGVLIDMARTPRKAKRLTSKRRRRVEGRLGRGGAAS